VQTVKHPRARSGSQDGLQETMEPAPPVTTPDRAGAAATASPLVTPGTPLWDLKKEDRRLSRKQSGRSSLMGSVSRSPAASACNALAVEDVTGMRCN